MVRPIRTIHPNIIRPAADFYWPWLVGDYLGDVINLVDVFCMKPRVSFISPEDGTWVTSPLLTARHYVGTLMCWVSWTGGGGQSAG